MNALFEVDRDDHGHVRSFSIATTAAVVVACVVITATCVTWMYLALTVPISVSQPSDKTVAPQAVKVEVAEIPIPEFPPDQLWERWAIVESWYESTQYEGRENLQRDKIVSPEGEWFYIPAADKEWAGGITEGVKTVLPPTVAAWPQSGPESTSDGDVPHEHMLGGRTSIRYRSVNDDGTATMFGRSKGIYFFAPRQSEEVATP